MTLHPEHPHHVIVTSAMRTGSTWLHSLLVQISGAQNHYVTSIADGLKVIRDTPSGMIKTHAVIDIDWDKVPPEVPIVRIIRNYKDSLISRALYVRNIRPSAGEPITEPAMLELLARIGNATDQEFMTAFIDTSPLVDLWLAEIAVMERGDSERCLTVMYETMMYNPYEMVAEIISVLWPDWTEGLQRVEATVRGSIHQGLNLRKQFQRKQAVGVGGWEAWLTAEQSDRLDARYYALKRLALKHASHRWDEVIQEL